MHVTAPPLETCWEQAHRGCMTTATDHRVNPLQVSELPTATPTHAGVLQTWRSERRALRQLRAFERSVAHLDGRTRAEVMNAARRDL